MDSEFVELSLEGRQIAFYRALQEGDDRLAGWYLGARIALATPGNPERFVQAAHSIRELMDGMHTIADVPAIADRRRLGDVFTNMTQKFQSARDASDCHQDGVWSGEIDDPARRAFRSVEEAIEWQRANRPLRAEFHRSTIRGLDVSDRTLPPSIEDRFVDLWSHIRDYFVAACHRREVDPDEFSGTLEALENFLLDRMKPRTFAEQETLDKLIKEAERG